MAEYSNTVKDGITPGGKSNNGAERSAMRGKANAAATSERERAAANSKLVRQQNWSGLTRSRRTNASPTKCSWFHDRTRTRRPATTRRTDPTTTTTASDGQRKGVEPQRSRAASAALAIFTCNLTARRPCPSFARNPRPDRRSNHQCHDATDRQPVVTTALYVRSHRTLTTNSFQRQLPRLLE
jgi:hypothetical protein